MYERSKSPRLFKMSIAKTIKIKLSVEDVKRNRKVYLGIIQITKGGVYTN